MFLQQKKNETKKPQYFTFPPLQHVSLLKTMSCSKNGNISPSLDEEKEKTHTILWTIIKMRLLPSHL